MGFLSSYSYNFEKLKCFLLSIVLSDRIVHTKMINKLEYLNEVIQIQIVPALVAICYVFNFIQLNNLFFPNSHIKVFS